MLLALSILLMGVTIVGSDPLQYGWELNDNNPNVNSNMNMTKEENGENSSVFIHTIIKQDGEIVEMTVIRNGNSMNLEIYKDNSGQLKGFEK